MEGLRCDLCRHPAKGSPRLCAGCQEMMRRLLEINSRMQTREISQAERLALKQIAGEAVAAAKGE